MSVKIKFFKLVGRDYLRKLVSEPTNDNCECNFCKYCSYIKFIKEELQLNGLKHIIKLLTAGELNILTET